MQRMWQQRDTKLALCPALFIMCLAFTVSGIRQVYAFAYEGALGPSNQQNVKTKPTPIPRPVGKVEYTEACLRISLLGEPGTYYVKADYVSRVGTRLQFSLESDGRSRLLLTYVEDEQLASMFLIGGNLVATVGDIGDHSVVRIFHLESNRVTVVFNRPVKGDPDFVWGPGETSDAETVLVYSGRNAKGNYDLPSEAEIYVWDGRAFTLKAKVSYRERFRALADMEQEAEK